MDSSELVRLFQSNFDPAFKRADFGSMFTVLEKLEKLGVDGDQGIPLQFKLEMQRARADAELRQKMGTVKVDPNIVEMFDQMLTHFGFDLAKYTKKVLDYNQMLDIPGRGPMKITMEDFGGPTYVPEITSHLKLICKLVGELNKHPDDTPWRNWFPKSSFSELCSSIANLDSYLNGKCQAIAYRRLAIGKRCDGSVVNERLAGQVIPNLLMPGMKRGDYRQEGGNKHVQSGLRIFFGPLYFTVKQKYDPMLKTVTIYRFMTHFHELTHKILKTKDAVYELVNCKKIQDTSSAIKCADSWAYYLTDYAEQTGQLPGEARQVNSKIAGLASKFGSIASVSSGQKWKSAN